MIDSGYIATMARYNRWQNASLIKAANTLPNDERRADRGAFFGSIAQTFSHLLWADMIWMHRFAQTPKPDGSIAQSADLFTDWGSFTEERTHFDHVIAQWALDLSADWLEGDLTWMSGAAQREVTKPKTFLVMHFFNHQTHHRGQIHSMLTQASAKPGDTDLFFLPD